MVIVEFFLQFDFGKFEFTVIGDDKATTFFELRDKTSGRVYKKAGIDLNGDNDRSYRVSRRILISS